MFPDAFPAPSLTQALCMRLYGVVPISCIGYWFVLNFLFFFLVFECCILVLVLLVLLLLLLLLPRNSDNYSLLKS